MKNTGSTQIAQRYVKALFDVAAPALEAVEKDMQVLGETLKANADFRHFLTNPLLTRGQHALAMEAVLTKIGAHKVTHQFIATLARNKRLTSLPEIVALFCDKVAQARGELKAQLIAPTPLNVRVVDMIAGKLGSVYGKKVNLEMRHDPDLLGGVIVRIGSIELDGSLAGKLDRLKQALKAA